MNFTSKIFTFQEIVTSTFLEYQFITKIFIWLYILTCKELQHVCENNLPWVCSSLWFVLLVLLYALYKCITLKVSGNNSETETSGEGLMEASFSNNLVFCFLDLCFASCRQCPQLNLLLCNAVMEKEQWSRWLNATCRTQFLTIRMNRKLKWPMNQISHKQTETD